MVVIDMTGAIGHIQVKHGTFRPVRTDDLIQRNAQTLRQK